MVSKKLIDGLWYHGDTKKYDTFVGRYMDAEDYSRDRNAMGPGIYFTRLKWQSSGYAEGSYGSEPGWIYTATMDLDPSRVLDKKTKPDEAKLRKFIDLYPDKEELEMNLYNYAQDLDQAREAAVEAAMDNENMLDATLGLYNDLYGKDSKQFGKSMAAIGYDAYLHKLPEVYHLIVYNPEIIQIKKVEKKLKHLKSRDDI